MILHPGIIPTGRSDAESPVEALPSALPFGGTLRTL
jgi:hypothetical protein